MSSKIEFRINRILFPKNGQLELGGYSIIACCVTKHISGEKIKVNPTYGNFSLLSYTPVIFNPLDSYVAEVEPEESKYGTSYKLVKLDKEPDKITEGDKRTFLEAVFTPYQLMNLLEAYPNAYDLIEKKDTEALLSVKGIGLKSIQSIYNKFDNNLKYQKIISALSEYKLTKSIMDNLLDRYKNADAVIKKVKENVYILADEVSGIGFYRADALALSSGMKLNDQRRIKAFMEYSLHQEAENGNSWVEPQSFLKSIAPNLKISLSNDEIVQALYSLNEDGKIYWDKDKTKIGLTYYYNLENDIYSHLKRLQEAESQYYTRDKNRENNCIKTCENDLGIEFTDEQKEAIDGILSNNVSILTAYSGCGKTVLTKTIGEIYKSVGLLPCFCTLSGKAAARIFEATGFEGSTIHRALGYNPQFQKFMFDEECQLPNPIIIVDEASFVGGELFLSLLKAIKSGAKLLLVGDDKQLPAIGACNIFFDMINSGTIKVNRLTKIHRQAAKSGIIVASKDIREGNQIIKNGWHGTEIRGELQDFIVDIYEDRLVSRPKLLDYYKRYVHNLTEAEDTQIILATKSKGDCNTFDINNEIQDYLNPKSKNKSEILLKRNEKNFVIREGDRVINRKNDYKAEIYYEYEPEFDDPEQTEVFNGFCGVVQKIFNNKVVVKFDMIKEPIIFAYEKLKNLELAYALTVHLFQGSQVKRVIYLIDNSSYIMNTRELVYTAITRASKECILLAQDIALKRATITSQTINKQTYLQNFLQGNA